MAKKKETTPELSKEDKNMLDRLFLYRENYLISKKQLKILAGLDLIACDSFRLYHVDARGEFDIRKQVQVGDKVNINELVKCKGLGLALAMIRNGSIVLNDSFGKKQVEVKKAQNEMLSKYKFNKEYYVKNMKKGIDI